MIQFLKNLSKRVINFWKEHVSSRLSGLLTAVEVIGLIASGLAIWGFSELADEVLDRDTQALDTQVLMRLRQVHSPSMDQAMIAVTTLGEPTILAVVSGLVGLWLLSKRRWAELVTLAVAAAGAMGLNSLLKIAFSRARPALWDQVIDVRYYSFPSGHAMISFVFYGILSYLLAKRFPQHQRLIFSLSALLVILIGFSRLYLGVHWPTDVIAGYAAGFVWLVTCVLSLEIYQRWRASSNGKKPTHRAADQG